MRRFASFGPKPISAMSNNIIVADNAGFCVGVKRATDSVENRIKSKRDGERIYTLGHLIHNDGYNA